MNLSPRSTILEDPAYYFYRNQQQQDLSTYFKGATKLHFMFYFRVVIILFSTGLYKSAFSAYDFGKTNFSSFCVLAFSCFCIFRF